jgi:microcystin degradation protein MlrC
VANVEARTVAQLEGFVLWFGFPDFGVCERHRNTFELDCTHSAETGCPQMYPRKRLASILPQWTTKTTKAPPLAGLDAIFRMPLNQ